MKIQTQILIRIVLRTFTRSTGNAPINVSPVGEGGEVWAMGGDLTAKSIPSIGGLIEYLCSGVGTFAFFRQRDWDQVSACLHSVFDRF